MSDVFDGDGSWMASDGKWYPPARHPDERYRARFAEPAETEDFPSVELRPQPNTGSRQGSFTELARSRATEADDFAVAETAELSGADLEIEMQRVAEQRRAAELTSADVANATAEIPLTDLPVNQPPTGDTPVPNAETIPAKASPEQQPAEVEHNFSVRPRESVPEPTERPVFDNTLAPSVVEAPPRQRAGLTEIEIDRPINTAPSREGSLISASSSVAPATSTSTSLVHVPNAAPAIGVPTPRDRLVASVLFLAGIGLIVGSFLDWTTGDLVQSGWERRDGIPTIIAGVVGASMAGPIYVGFRHTGPKLIAIVAGVIAAIVLGLVAVSNIIGVEGIEFGLGFYVTAVAAVVTIVAALFDQGELLS